MKPNELQLADVVTLVGEEGNPFQTMTVVNIMPNNGVRLIRPFVHTEDFSYSGGVLHHLGWEYVTYHFSGNHDFVLHKRKPLK